MFKLSNLKKFTKDNWTYLSCDFDVTDNNNPFQEKTMWVAVEEKNEDMLADNVYDPFVLVPVILGMYYKQDVHIDGNISPRFYHNMQHYLMNIFDRFSDHTSPIKFTVRGFDTVKQTGNLVGTGISCGVDSLVTIYDNYINETDLNFRINSLFFVNCGTHGDYEDENSHKKYWDRVSLNKAGADDLGLPMYLVNSNFHAFTHKIGEERIGYLAIYSCILSLQKCIRRYYTSSNLSYDEIIEFSRIARDFDIAEYSESFMSHLVSTENFELVIDGCQYTRAEKTERISDWKFAQEHLNVCVPTIKGGRNCSCCSKCMMTLFVLDILGKLEKFTAVFDLDVYRKNTFYWRCVLLTNYNKIPVQTSIIRYMKEHGVNLPPRWFAKIYCFAHRGFRKIGLIKSKE